MNKVNRRDFLHVGIAGAIALPDVLRAQAASVKPKAKSVIVIYLPGGVSHADTWDYKPNGTPEYRGPFAPIKSKTADLHMSDLMKHTSQISDRITVIRSMTHGEAAHERGTHNMLTGYRPNPSLKYPSIGSVISHELGGQNDLPAYVTIPSVFDPAQGSGYLSTAFGPFAIGSNPEDKGFTVRDLSIPKGLEDRSTIRRSLLQAVDQQFSSANSNTDAIVAADKFTQAAFNLTNSTAAQTAFDLSKETAAVKSLYGDNAAGMRLLLARRLVQAGVRTVTVTYGGWDHHSNLQSAMISNMVNFDKAYAALITDLQTLGMLNDTLVIISSEFGRTPKINGTNGRDHHPRVFSVALAGGGIKQGFVYGTSDAVAAEPDSNPVTPEDLAATMYHLIGIDSTKRLVTSDLRPIDIVRGGNVINKILA